MTFDQIDIIFRNEEHLELKPEDIESLYMEEVTKKYHYYNILSVSKEQEVENTRYLELVLKNSANDISKLKAHIEGEYDDSFGRILRYSDIVNLKFKKNGEVVRNVYVLWGGDPFTNMLQQAFVNTDGEMIIKISEV